MITPSEQVPHEWARVHFAGAELSRVKQVDRVLTIAEAMAQSPGATLPQMFAHPYDLKATYKLFADPEATPDHLQAGHREGVLLELEKPGCYWLIEATSEIRCADKAHPLPGLGPIGASKEAKIGFHLHSVLAVKWPEACDSATVRRPAVEILGLADQQYHVRQPRPAHEPPHSSARRVRPAAQLESVLWEQACVRLGPAPTHPDVTWVKVGDRGSDIYDHLVACQNARQRFVMRACKERVLVDEDDRAAGKLFVKARASASLGTVELDLRARAQQPARKAQLAISVTSVRLRAPGADLCGGAGVGAAAARGCQAPGMGAADGFAGRHLRTSLPSGAHLRDALAGRRISEGAQNGDEGRGLAIGNGARMVCGDRPAERRGVASVGAAGNCPADAGGSCRADRFE